MPWSFHTGFETGDCPVELDDRTGGNQVVTHVVSTAQARSGARSLRIASDNDFDQYEPTVATGTYQRDSTADRILVAFSIRPDSYFSWWSTPTIFYVNCGSSGTGGAAVIEFKTDGSIDLEFDSDIDGLGVTQVNVPGALYDQAWNDIELVWLPDHSAGEYALYVNGIEVASETGIDTFTGSGTPNINYGFGFRVATTTVESGTGFYLDDFRIGHGFPLAGVGHVSHELLVPTSDIETDGATTGSSNHFENVDEVPSSGADYNTLDAAAERERYGMSDRVDVGAPLSVTVHGQLSDPDGTSTGRLILESNGTEVDGPDASPTATAKLFHSQPVDEDPDTAAAWTGTAVDALTAGARATSV